MNVAELIEELKKMPQDASIGQLWDGAVRTRVNFVWLSRGGEVVTADYGQSAYYDQDRPDYAPYNEESWSTPCYPEDEDCP